MSTKEGTKCGRNACYGDEVVRNVCFSRTQLQTGRVCDSGSTFDRRAAESATNHHPQQMSTKPSRMSLFEITGKKSRKDNNGSIIITSERQHHLISVFCCFVNYQNCIGGLFMDSTSTKCQEYTVCSWTQITVRPCSHDSNTV